MTRDEASKILGISPDANKYEIEHRYTLLSKRYRGKTDPQSMAEIQEFTTAFDILTDRYVPPAPPDPRQEEVVFGKKRKDWANIWHYGRLPLLGGLLVAALVFWLIYSVVTNKDPDFRVSIFGDFAVDTQQDDPEDLTLNGLIDSQNPELEYPLTDFQLISERPGTDFQMVMASQMKLTLMLSGAEKVDILLLDRIQYERIVSEGILLPMDELYRRISEADPELVETFIEPLEHQLSAEFIESGHDTDPHIYGLDFSETQAFNSLRVVGPEQIVALCYHSERSDKAEDVLEKLILSIEDWYNPEIGTVSFPETVPSTPTGTN